MAVNVYIVETARVHEVWPVCAGMLEKAVGLTHGRDTTEKVRANVESGDYQLFVAMEEGKIVGACVTHLAEYPNAIWLRVVHCGGDHLERWIGQGFEAVRDWARLNKCAGIDMVTTRKEWARLLDLKITAYRMELVL